MRRELHAEWTKLRTVGSTAWLLAATSALTVLVGVLVMAGVHGSDGPQDLPKLALGGVQYGQVTMVVLACLAVGAEYGTGTIGPTLVAMPNRFRVFAAKTLVVAAAAAAVGALGTAASLVIGRLVMSSDGLPPLPLSDGPTLRAALGTVLYLALVALLSLGLATALRDSGVAVITVLSILYAMPIATRLVSSEHWKRRLEKYAPMKAGLSIQSTKNLAALPLSPWHGLGILALYATACLALGFALFRLRDA
ncbi:ABC transporter permease [Actinomadura rupiterrae]|uniref:ABC transporter permease n=1 Tax=Actinomadura rupiterrae TaxID=559627 RepID=UPI0020A5ED93|nr:ABC transporter permease [Actinomadura rupiterrae]MCP2334801.1 ABC-2 type transport system permease protein [Actinomadura rupiterrae]